jgi:hypothetical protein
MVQALLNTSNGRRPPQFFHQAVRHLVLEDESSYSPDDGRKLLRLCTGLVSFASPRLIFDPNLLPILADLGIVQRLCLSPQILFASGSFDLTHSAFQSVTHLDAFGGGMEEALADISALPALTHLCLDPAVPWDALTQVLVKCPRLELLLVQWSVGSKQNYEAAQKPGVYDLRLVIGLYEDYWKDWEDEVKGVLCYWTEADAFVAKKRRGEIERNVFSATWTCTVSDAITTATRYWMH